MGDLVHMACEQGLNFEGLGVIQPDACTAPNRQVSAIR